MIKVKSPANIAFVKHWGMSPQGMPLSCSVSMNLSNCYTITLLEENQDGTDLCVLNDQIIDFATGRNCKILDMIQYARLATGSKKFVTIRSSNNFPTSTGIASSASGFSALAVGLKEFYNLQDDIVKFTARSGSISACRSLLNEFCGVDTKLAVSDFEPRFSRFELVDIVLILEESGKSVSSSEGQSASKNSLIFGTRINEANRDYDFLLGNDFSFTELGKIIEKQAILLHLTTILSDPAFNYYNLNTLLVIEKTWELRKNGLEIYFTIDAGCNVHIICRDKDKEDVLSSFRRIDFIKNTIINYPTKGAHIIY